MIPPTRKPRTFDLTNDSRAVLDGPGPSPHNTLIEVSPFETKVLRRALKRLRYEVAKDMKRNEETGWQPQPGKEDVLKHTMNAIVSLMGRLPFPQGDEQ